MPILSTTLLFALALFLLENVPREGGCLALRVAGVMWWILQGALIVSTHKSSADVSRGARRNVLFFSGLWSTRSTRASVWGRRQDGKYYFILLFYPEVTILRYPYFTRGSCADSKIHRLHFSYWRLLAWPLADESHLFYTCFASIFLTGGICRMDYVDCNVNVLHCLSEFE